MRQVIREPKSIKIPSDILEWMRHYRTQFASEVACGLEIGVSRDVVNRALVFGSCSPKSFKRIEKAFNKNRISATAA